MQSHSREATGTVTPFDKYAESKSRSDCWAVTVAKRLLPNFVKYAEAKTLVHNISISNLWLDQSQRVIIVDLSCELSLSKHLYSWNHITKTCKQVLLLSWLAVQELADKKRQYLHEWRKINATVTSMSLELSTQIIVTIYFLHIVINLL